jgi:hypothetical protein
VGSREGSAERETQDQTADQVQGKAEEGEDVEMQEPVDNKGEESEPDSPLSPPPAEDTPQIVVEGEADTMDTT